MNAMSFFEKISGLQRKREQNRPAVLGNCPIAGLGQGARSGGGRSDSLGSRQVGRGTEIDFEKGQERMAMHAMANSLPKLQKDRKQILKDIDRTPSRGPGNRHQRSRPQIERSESYLEQAKSCRKPIEENRKLREKLVRQREDIEKRMRKI